MVRAAQLTVCGLAYGYNRHGRCAWCGRDLPRNRDGTISRARVWCSPDHGRAYAENHSWTDARRARIRRDRYRCVRCGHPDLRAVGTLFAIIHAQLGGTVRWPLYGTPMQRESAAGSGLEVNHVAPCGGRHGQTGCHHHQSNLETLCPPHHAEVTRAQTRARAAVNRALR